MKFAVFLDVDGVLNTRTTCEHTPDGYTGIDDARVEILAGARYNEYVYDRLKCLLECNFDVELLHNKKIKEYIV